MAAAWREGGARPIFGRRPRDGWSSSRSRCSARMRSRYGPWRGRRMCGREGGAARWCGGRSRRTWRRRRAWGDGGDAARVGSAAPVRRGWLDGARRFAERFPDAENGVATEDAHEARGVEIAERGAAGCGAERDGGALCSGCAGRETRGGRGQRGEGGAERGGHEGEGVEVMAGRRGAVKTEQAVSAMRLEMRRERCGMGVAGGVALISALSDEARKRDEAVAGAREVGGANRDGSGGVGSEPVATYRVSREAREARRGGGGGRAGRARAARGAGGADQFTWVRRSPIMTPWMMSSWAGMRSG